MIPQNKNLPQNGFTLWNARIWRTGKADSTGFIPMMIMLLVVLVALIVIVYLRVHKAQGY